MKAADHPAHDGDARPEGYGQQQAEAQRLAIDAKSQKSGRKGQRDDDQGEQQGDYPARSAGHEVESTTNLTRRQGSASKSMSVMRAHGRRQGRSAGGRESWRWWGGMMDTIFHAAMMRHGVAHGVSLKDSVSGLGVCEAQGRTLISRAGARFPSAASLAHARSAAP
ncbi:MAG: hypothetical protein ACK4TK_06340 [Thiobacillaceae bacterium]